MFDCRVGGLNRAAPNARSLNGSAIQGEAMQHFNALQRACADQGTDRCSDRHSSFAGRPCPPPKNAPHAVR
ncbi:hypothetical protein SAMCCGM7_Ch3166 [Sinorhizobium americanum CCGM7]|nr:hypothetical protein SAMCCGM7_Ch3166 [Sinorhizobium americanum CCGM7]